MVLSVETKTQPRITVCCVQMPEGKSPVFSSAVRNRSLWEHQYSATSKMELKVRKSEFGYMLH